VLLADLDAEDAGVRACWCLPQTPDAPAVACGACLMRAAVALAEGTETSNP
jgi:hypothetical protein